MPPIIPKSELDAVRWMRAFADEIARDAAAYRISEEESKAISAAVDALEAAREEALGPEGRCPTAVRRTCPAREEAMQICRRFAQQINRHRHTTDAHRVALGLRPKRRPSSLDLSRPEPLRRNLIAPTT